jgi:hypothetical protein
MDWEPSPQPQAFASHTPGGFAKPPALLNDQDEDEDMGASMATSRNQGDWDNFGIGKQRMFPGQTGETGLESLLAGWDLGGGGGGSVKGSGEAQDDRQGGQRAKKGWLNLWS